ncbi:MAG: TolC family protein [Clostridia bacterium]|nr:TolC family protein [Spirochaetia bacterium]
MRITIYFVVPLILIISGFGSAPAGALELEEALNLASGSADARLAVLQGESAAAALTASSYPGDTSLSFAPAYKRVSDELSGISRNDAFYVDLSVSLPLGLESSASDRMNQAAIQADLAVAALPWNLEQTRLRAYTLYTAAWLAQEEAGLAFRERDLAEEEFSAARFRFTAGSIAYGDFRNAEEALLEARDEAIYADMRRRVSRLELFSWLGVPDDTLPFEMTRVEAGTLPRAPDMAAHAVLNDPEIQQAMALEALSLSQMEDLLGLSIPLTVKLGVLKDEHDANLSFATDSRKLAVTYSLPVIDLTGDFQSKPWTISASVGLALDAGSGNEKQAELLRLDAEAEKLRLESLIAELSLNVRLSHQAWSRAVDIMEQAERNAQLSAEIFEMAKARAATGSVTPAELARAELDAARAAFTAKARAIDAERARYNAAITARYSLD